MQIVADYSSLVSGAVSRSVKEGEVVVPLSAIALLEKEMIDSAEVDRILGSSSGEGEEVEEPEPTPTK